MRNIFRAVVYLFLLASFSLHGQSKPPLDHTVYDSWQKISNHWLSPDGHYLVYTVDPQQGDGMLYIKNLLTNRLDSCARGTAAAFTPGSTHVIVKIKPGYEEIRQAKIAKKKPEDMPKDDLLIFDLVHQTDTTTANVKSFAVAEKDRNLVVYLSEKTAIDTSKSKKPEANGKEGSPLTILYLDENKSITIPYVTEYKLSKSGNSLAFETSGSRKDSSHLVAIVARMNLQNVQVDTLARGSIGATKYAFDEQGDQLAFVATLDSSTAQIKKHHLRYHRPGMDSATIKVSPGDPGLPPGWQISENSNVRFSKNGQRLLFGTAEIPAAKDTSVPEFEQAKVDVWHYNDDYLQPMQLTNLDRDLKKNYLALIEGDHTMVQVSDEDLENMVLSDEENGRFALGRTDKGQRVALQWEGDTKEDIYLIDLLSGSKQLIRDDLDGNVSISPGGKFILWYENKTRTYFVHDNVADKSYPLTKLIKTSLADEENDSPDDPRAYGICGWKADDQKVYIYDRYDIWEVDPKGLQAPINFTKNLGRSTKTELRVVRLDPEERFFTSNQRLLLSALQDKDKQRGFYTSIIDQNQSPVKSVISGHSYGSVIKAKYAATLAYTKGNYEHSPDLYTSTNFTEETKHTAINPQQAGYNWGTVDLIQWKTLKGKSTSGLLYKPEDFDPSKKYPMIVYFYEKLSDGRYTYQAPAPTPSRLNIPYFVSNGYLVLVPDIAYEIGHPGPSAYDHIVSGVEYLKKNPWVDAANIGLQGQSWGGYQALYVITQTNLFKAAWAGAPVVNMFSAYGGIRWASGLNRQMQYEKTQSRLGATPWQRRDLYIENSPLFHLPKITTPLAIMANDADGAVPWYQGIELFTDMRRLGKKVWMLNYNGEAHNLVERRNQKDISIREAQFFDHFLKSAPAPKWIESGVKAVDKGKTWGLEIKKS
ncbi:MAG: S9 family peptidase [Saprospiraceae bacterium]|nr:S9 family peptidase [Saprospiraceae bacterium]